MEPAYKQRKRLYREIMGQKANECDRLLNQGLEEFDSHPFNVKFNSDHRRLSDQFFDKVKLKEVLAVADLLLEKKIISEPCSNELTKLISNNLRDRFTSSSTCLLLYGLIHFRQANYLEAIDIMAESGMDFNPGTVIRARSSEYFPPQPDVGFERRLHINLSWFQSISPVEILLQPCSAKVMLNTIKALLNNGLTDLGLSFVSFHKLVIKLVENLTSGEEWWNLPRSEIAELVDLLLSYEAHDPCIKRFKEFDGYEYYKHESTRFEVMLAIREHILESASSPPTLQNISRITIRSTIGGVHFKSKVNQLPLPETMKAYIIGSLPRTTEESEDGDS